MGSRLTSSQSTEVLAVQPSPAQDLLASRTCRPGFPIFSALQLTLLAVAARQHPRMPCVVAAGTGPQLLGKPTRKGLATPSLRTPPLRGLPWTASSAPTRALASKAPQSVSTGQPKEDAQPGSLAPASCQLLVPGIPASLAAPQARLGFPSGRQPPTAFRSMLERLQSHQPGPRCKPSGCRRSSTGQGDAEALAETPHPSCSALSAKGGLLAFLGRGLPFVPGCPMICPSVLELGFMVGAGGVCVWGGGAFQDWAAVLEMGEEPTSCPSGWTRLHIGLPD